MDDQPEVIVGIDVVTSGTKLSDYMYALAVLRDNEITLYENVSLSRLIRLLWELRPKLIALDNIMELGGSRENLIKILQLLPPESMVVQVTLNDSELIDLRKLAFKAGIQLEQGKLSPQKTAEVLALLSSRGYGTVLKLFEDKVKIVIGRKMALGPGGSSSNRFKRSLRTSILGATRRLKEELDRSGFDYDLTFRKSEGGIDRALFTVYAPRHELSHVIRSIKGYEVSVKVKHVIKRNFLNIISGSTHAGKYLIVGVDPGIETGLAIVDLDLRPLVITSGRNLDREDILQITLKYGKPILITTDKNPPPEMVEKIAANLNATLYYPPKSLSSIEKDALVYDYILSYRLAVKNTHERDSLASCIKAYREFEDKFRQLTAKLNEIGLPVSKLQRYKAEIVKGKSIADVIEEIISNYISKEGPGNRDLIRVIKLLASEEVSKKDKELLSQIEKISKERDALRLRIKELEKKLSELETELILRNVEFDAEVAKDREVSELKHRLRNLSDYIGKLEGQLISTTKLLEHHQKLFHLIFTGNHVLVRRLRKLTAEELMRSTQEIGTLREDEVVFVDKLHNVEEEGVLKTVKDLRLKLLVPKPDEGPSDMLDKYELVIYQCDNFMEVSDTLALIPNSVISELSRIEEEVRERSRKKFEISREKLIDMIREYRGKRFIKDSEH